MTMSGSIVEYSPAPPTDGPLPLPPDPRTSIDHVLHMIWRRRWLFVSVFGVVTMVGGLFLVHAPVQYTAHAIAMVGERSLDFPSTDGAVRVPTQQEPNLDGEIQLIMSRLALRRVVEELNLPQSPEFRPMLEKRRSAEFTAIRQQVNALLRGVRGQRGDNDTSTMADRAAAFGHKADAVAAQAHHALAAAVDPTDTIADALLRSLKVVAVGRSRVLDISFTARNPVLAAEVANAVASNGAVNDAFQGRFTMAERVGFNMVQIWTVSKAAVPLTPSSPDALLVAFATLVLAGGAAFSCVLFAEFRTNRTLLSTEQLTRRGVRALGLIPDLGRRASRRCAVVNITEQAEEAFSESIAALYTSLATLLPQKMPSGVVLMFASALPFEGKSTTVAALATSIASDGRRVLVIDADLRSPSLHRAFGVRSEGGVTSCLNPKADLDALIHVDPISGVSVLRAGAYHHRPHTVLRSPRLRQAIQEWRNSFDFILIDTPPVLALADARIVAPLSDYCVFVARWGKTGWNTVSRSLQLLTENGARIAGVALSRVDVRQLATYDFADSEAYGRSYRRHVKVGMRNAQVISLDAVPSARRRRVAQIAALILSLSQLSPSHALGEYLLDRGDVLEITVSGPPSLRRRAAVNADGEIVFPAIGALNVAGLSLPALRLKLQESLIAKNVFRNPDVIVELAEYRPFYISGDVAKPGAYPYQPGITVREAVALAGGYDFLQLHARRPFFEAADAQGDYETLSLELVKQEVRIARLQAALAGKAELDFANVPTVPPQSLAMPEVVALETRQLKLDLDNYEKERTYLEQMARAIQDQLSILDQRQEQETHNLAQQTADLARVQDLARKGVVSVARLMEEQRAIAISQTRLFEVKAQAAQARKDFVEFARRLQKTADQRQMDLLKELQESVAELARVRSRLGAAREKLGYTAAKLQATHGAAKGPEIAIHRQAQKDQPEIVADADTKLFPGDVVQITVPAEFGMTPVGASSVEKTPIPAVATADLSMPVRKRPEPAPLAAVPLSSRAVPIGSLPMSEAAGRH
jgi:polysaccharide export outer membrane protein